ncbi:hypothetical protein PV326_012136, partial [Microctonus aethiopoides]
MFPEREAKKQLSLTALVSETLSLCTKKAHNAEYDVYMLEQLIEKHLNIADIINDAVNFDQILQKLNQNELADSIIPSLKPLENVISPNLIRRLAMFGIDYALILKTLEQRGTNDTFEILQHKNNG